jgi:hypothetical protein
MISHRCPKGCAARNSALMNQAWETSLNTMMCHTTHQPHFMKASSLFSRQLPVPPKLPLQLIQLRRHCPMPRAAVYMVPSMIHTCRAPQPQQTCTVGLGRRRCSSTVGAQPVQNVHRPSRSRHQAQTRHSMQQPTILTIPHHAHLTQLRQGIRKTCSMTSTILLRTAQRERSATAQKICQKS